MIFTNRKKLVTRILILLQFLLWNSFACKAQDSVIDVNALYSCEETIPMREILGEWETLDVAKETVTLVEKPFEITLSTHNGITYSFKKDKWGNTKARGFLMQWPPRYCHISKINAKELELTYFGVGHVERVQRIALVKRHEVNRKTLKDSVFSVGDKIIGPDIVLYSSRLRPYQIDSIEQIAIFLQNNSNLFVEVGFHTSHRGSDIYNLNYSQKVAELVCTTLTKRFGINEDRIKPYGAGESEPIISEEEIGKATAKLLENDLHDINSRTELRIMAIGKIEFLNPNLTNSKAKVLYNGYPNKLEVTGIEIDSTFYLVNENNDTLRSDGNYFLVMWHNFPDTSTTLTLVRGNQEYYSSTFRQEKLHDPKCYLGSIRDTNVHVAQLLQNPGLKFSYEPQLMICDISVFWFDGAIIKKSGRRKPLTNYKKENRLDKRMQHWSKEKTESWLDEYYSSSAGRSCFNSKQLKMIKKMKSGDVLWISTTKIISSDSCSAKHSPNLKFLIK